MLRKLILIAISLCLIPWQVLALGLGQPEILSELNQPLQARIPLLLSPDERLTEIQVQLASEIEFAKQHIPRFAYLNNLQFKVIEINQRSFIQVTTAQAIVEPILHFLLQIDTPAGKLINAYTFLLDPSDSNPLDGAKTTYEPVQQNESFPNKPVLALIKESPTQPITTIIPKVNNFIQPINGFNLNNAIAHSSTNKPVVAGAEKLNSLEVAESASIIPVQQELLETRQALAKSQQAYTDLKQAQSRLVTDVQALTQKNISLTNELQLKTVELVQTEQKAAELTNKITNPKLANSTASGWFEKFFVGLIILAGLTALMVYLNRNQRFKIAGLNFSKKLDWPDFLAKFKPWFTAKLFRTSTTHDNSVIEEKVIEPVESEANNFAQSVASKPQMNTTAPAIEPLEEAGIYLVYGRHEQAQKVLLAALEKNPDDLDLKQKLLEVYAAKNDRAMFEQLANQIRTSLAGDNAEFWQKIHELHRKAWPEQYDEKVVSDNHQADAKETPQITEEQVELAMEQDSEATSEAQQPVVDINEFTQESSAVAHAATEILLSNEDVVATKLEMARSCIEIGAIPDARKLLLEVQKLGDEAQRKEAERLLQRLS